MYKVIKFFTDLQDGSHPYNVGDMFPRKGKTVSADRLAELSGSNNRQKTPLIEKVTAKAPSKVKETPRGEAVAVETDEKPKPRGRRKKES